MSARIDVSNKVYIWAKNGVEVKYRSETIEVSNTWNDRERILLKVGDIEVEVAVDDLYAAIHNACNAAFRY